MNKVIAAQSNGDVIVSWETNYPTFGHVVYGIATDTPYVYDQTKPNFGYAQSVPTDPSIAGHDDPLGKLLNHTYTLTGLTKGATYKIRILSHGSPVTVDEEATVTIPSDEQAPVTEPTVPATEGGEQPVVTFAAPTEDSSGNASILTGGATAGSETLGAEEPEVIAPADTATATDETNADANLAAAGASSGMNIWWWLLILIAAATGGYYLQKKNKDGKK
jgi:hypothetical protein